MSALTVMAIDELKPRADRYEVSDGKVSGLRMVVQPSGKRSWIIRYRSKGDRTPKKLTLGAYPGLSLKNARACATKELAIIGDGGDPAALKRAKATAEREASADTVEAVVERFVARYLQAKKLRSWAETKRLLEREIVGAWKGRPLASITKKDVHALLDGVMDRGAPIMANRTLSALRKMCGWAAERGIIVDSPCLGVKPPAAESSRDRVLNDDEIAAVWRGCDAIGGPFVPLFRLLILTGQRRDEVGEMRWAEVDLQARTLTFPAGRVKNASGHIVPLSAPAVAILERIKRIDGAAGYVFTTSGVAPLSGFSKAKDRLDAAIAAAGADVPAWRLHDLRRSFASGCARLGIALPVIERALNHISGSFRGVVGVYQRHDFLAERRAAMDAWGRHVEAIVTGESGNVVELAAVRS